jgi:transposase
VLATIRALSRLEHGGETLRHALNQLAVEAPAWLRVHADPPWVARSSKRITEYRLPQADAERQALGVTIGQDGYRLLAALSAPATPRWLRELPAAPRGYPTLRQVWVQQS